MPKFGPTDIKSHTGIGPTMHFELRIVKIENKRFYKDAIRKTEIKLNFLLKIYYAPIYLT